MKPRIIIASFLSLLIFSSCEKQQSGPPGETATTGSFQLVADEVLKPVVDSLVQGFMIENKDAKVTVKYVSAAEAVRELMNHDARAIIIDRNLTPTERAILQKDSVTLPEFQLAKDGIGVMVPNSDIDNGTSIRLSYLQNLFGNPKTLTTGAQQKVFTAYPSSIEYVMDSIMGVTEAGGITERYQTTDSILQRMAKDRNAIAFVSSAWKHWLEDDNHDTRVKFLPVIPHDLSSQGISEPVLLHIAYIAEGVYPLLTRVNGYSFEVPNTIPRGFLAYASTAHGQTVFKNFGILPGTQPIRLVESK